MHHSPDVGDPVLTEVRGTALVITLNRPTVRNAIDAPTATALDAALSALDDDERLRAGILTGAGGHFCSGMDLKAFPEHGIPTVAERGLAGLTRSRRSTPLIAAVEGAAVAGGFELALACDLIVAGESAFFGLPEVARGLVASEGGAIRLPGRLPYHLAMELLLTGDRLPAFRAEHHGLINRLVPDGQAVTAALELAERISRHTSDAVTTVKRIVHSTRGHDEPTAFILQDPISKQLMTSPQAAAGARRFTQRTTRGASL
ncbi:crotonase/enoyl-CoA hydratase family protein [Streptomyces adustus]|uniref:Crotonase/enoyl-CoA hydratase family protein n=1 Tax=Streptomyces adustus TaxID=1609272 RepID=A0A5N8VE37_9ACTN|nr:crotonase/enoyl-CoA hydratase family protein [Streptomyces adustus]MPY33510.1 crotonase/enoyl-CoA hydratase family protein [Streptomyces adustus]